MFIMLTTDLNNRRTYHGAFKPDTLISLCDPYIYFSFSAEQLNFRPVLSNTYIESNQC